MKPSVLSTTLVAAALVLASCSGGDDATPLLATTTTSPDTAPRGWPTAGFDLANSRALPDARIDTTTVADLEPLWRAELDGAAALTTVPIVADGTAYLAAATGVVYALDLETGEQRWASEPTGFNIGPFGVAVDDERVYTLDGSSGVLALARDDGSRLWATDVTSTTTGIDIQPIVVGDLVLVSSVPISLDGIYAPGDRGVVYALDAATGEVRWSFDTVDGDLWGHPEVNSGGGAWYPPAVDEELGVVYVGVANPAPFPGTTEWPNGSSRPGPNLYTDSLVALDLATGALLWYHQVTPHDLFDRDQVHALIAGDTVVSAGKSGVLVGLDPTSGTRRWRTEVGLHRNDTLETLDGPTEIAPGTYGGILTPPATADGVIYAAVVNAPTTLSPDETAYFGADLGQLDGDVVAVDATDGSVLWSTPVPGSPLGGATVVGDLVLTALLGGGVIALRRDDGAIVRTIDTGGGVNGWMAALSDRLLVPVGMSDPPALLALGLPD